MVRRTSSHRGLIRCDCRRCRNWENIENGLTVLEEITPISARMVVNRVSMKIGMSVLRLLLMKFVNNYKGYYTMIRIISLIFLKQKFFCKFYLIVQN